LIFAAIRPTLTNITSLQKKIDDQEILNKKAENKIAELFNAQTQLNQYQDKLGLFDTAVPDIYSYYDMAGRIEYLANKFGVVSETVSMPGAKLFGQGKPLGTWATKLLTKDASNIVSAGVTFSIIGSPQNVISMISKIENMDRLTRLKSVVLTKEISKVGTTGVLRADGQIYFYFYQPGL
jgi:hypothetical protein